MKILFIYPIPPPRLQIPRYQSGIGYISVLLKRHGHKTHLYTPHRYEEKAIVYDINTFKPDLIGFSLVTNQAKLAFRIIDYIHSYYRLPMVIGGVHPTVAPEDCIHRKGIIGICRGEGDNAMLDLVTAMEAGRDYTATKNFWFNVDGQVIKNPIRPLLEDLDKLPFPDREIFDFKKLLREYPRAEIMTGRGCPYRCSYCMNQFLQQFSGDGKRFIRQRSVSNVLMELEELTRTYDHIQTMLFGDDTFAIDRSWLEEFSRDYRKRFKIPFSCNTRVDIIDKEKLKWLKEAGCIQINFGLESGNDFIRKSILKKNITRSQIIEACRMVKEMGIKVSTFNMVGVPYESVDSIKETIDLNRAISPDYIFCSIFHPFPGTELYDLCKEKGWLSQREVSSFYESVSILEQPSISSKEVTYYYEIFKGLVLYPGMSRVIKLMARIKILPGYSLYRLFQEIVWILTRTISSNLPFSFKRFIKAGLMRVRKLCR